jgi:pSer/pThr/pTyr-binding forkhead associated (FHA) protein
MSRLVLKFNDETLKEFALEPGDTTIGRRPDNHIVIDSLAVSSQHASIYTVGKDSFIQDLQSTNGTFINNKRINRHHLAHGDEILIGKHLLVFDGETATAAPVVTKTVPPSERQTESTSSTGAVPAMPASPARQGALFILTGPNSGKRIDLTKATTYLGKTGKPAGAVVQTAQGYRLRPAEDTEIPQLNARPVPDQGEDLKNGDIIEVADTRLQFYLK